MSLKLNTKTLYEKQLLSSKLQASRDFDEIVFTNTGDRLLLLKTRGAGKKNKPIVGYLSTEMFVIDNIEYIRFIDESQLSLLSRKTAKGNQSEFHLLGDDDE